MLWKTSFVDSSCTRCPILVLPISSCVSLLELFNDLSSRFSRSSRSSLRSRRVICACGTRKYHSRTKSNMLMHSEEIITAPAQSANSTNRNMHRYIYEHTHVRHSISKNDTKSCSLQAVVLLHAGPEKSRHQRDPIWGGWMLSYCHVRRNN